MSDLRQRRRVQPADVSSTTAPATAPVSTVPQPEGNAEACERARTQAGRICQAAPVLCEIAEENPDLEGAPENCDWALAACERETEEAAAACE